MSGRRYAGRWRQKGGSGLTRRGCVYGAFQAAELEAERAIHAAGIELLYCHSHFLLS